MIVKENLYRWTNWKITQANQPWEKQDSRTIHFPGESCGRFRGGGALHGAVHVVTTKPASGRPQKR